MPTTVISGFIGGIGTILISAADRATLLGQAQPTGV